MVALRAAGRQVLLLVVSAQCFRSRSFLTPLDDIGRRRTAIVSELPLARSCANVPSVAALLRARLGCNELQEQELLLLVLHQSSINLLLMFY